MYKHIDLLSRSPLFENIRTADLEKLLNCLSPIYRSFEKNVPIFKEEQESNFFGIILSGGVHLVRNDYWGNRLIMGRIAAGHIFGETFSLENIPKFPVSFVAGEKSQVLILSSKRALRPCSSMCGSHSVLIQNILRDMAKKNMLLISKIEYISRRNTREKLLSYLSAQSRLAKSKIFDIPFNRQELADYLSVDRSAMSAELGRMRNDGLIDFHKNHFELCQRNSPLTMENM